MASCRWCRAKPPTADLALSRPETIRWLYRYLVSLSTFAPALSSAEPILPLCRSVKSDARSVASWRALRRVSWMFMAAPRPPRGQLAALRRAYSPCRSPAFARLGGVSSNPAPPRVVAVVGATAAGKSDLAVALARAVGGEVVNTDSMQLYRGMDIGTAKLTPAERRGVPHHLLDVWDVTVTASVAEYQRMARETMD